MKRDPVCNMDVDERTAPSVRCNGEIHYFCSEGCRKSFLDGRTCTAPANDYDLIIIGGGPAALTAAVYASTLKVDTLLLARDLGGQAIDSTKIENYMGFDFITGPELTAKFEHQLLHTQFVAHRLCDVEIMEPIEGGFAVRTSDFRTYTARAVIAATGMTRRKLRVPGEEEFQRRGVFYGNIQDLSFVEDSDVAVIGGGNSALQMCENLAPVVRKIHVISDGPLRADPAVIERVRAIPWLTFYEGCSTLAFSGGDRLESVAIRKKGETTERSLPVGGVFVAIGLVPNSALVAGLANLNPRGEVEIGKDCSTSYPGLFAAGDVTDAFGKRIVIAAGEGAKATLAARRYLIGLRKKADQKVAAGAV